MSESLPTISADDLDMLMCYSSGHPRIYDAAHLMSSVWSLLEQKLIEPVVPVDPYDANTEYRVDWNNGKACRLTDLGRQVLEAQS